MALTDSFPGVSGAVDSTELRKNLAGLIVRDTAGVPRAGIFPRHTNALVTARSDMALDVSAFEGVSVRGGGPLLMANDGVAQSPALATAPASNSRIDVLYFKQNENGYGGFADGVNTPVFGVATGVAAASPTKPSIAGIAGAVELATITIPSTATATNSSGVVITNTFQYTAAAGGTVLFRTATERDLFAAANGTGALLIDSGAVQIRSAAAWIPVGGAMPGGRVVRTGTAGGFGTGWSPLTTGSLWAVDQPVTGGVTFSNGVFTVSTAGVYDIEGSVMLDSSVAATLIAKKNSTAADAAGVVGGATCGAGPSSFTLVAFRERVRLAAGDTVALAILFGTAAQWSNDKLAPSFFGIRYVEPLR